MCILLYGALKQQSLTTAHNLHLVYSPSGSNTQGLRHMILCWPSDLLTKALTTITPGLSLTNRLSNLMNSVHSIIRVGAYAVINLCIHDLACLVEYIPAFDKSSLPWPSSPIAQLLCLCLGEMSYSLILSSCNRRDHEQVYIGR